MYIKGTWQLEEFMKLPKRAQQLFFEIIFSNDDIDENPCIPFMVAGMINEYCESPIEQIFYLAFTYESFKRNGGYILLAQEEIETQSGKYRADFLFSTSENTSPYVEFEEEYNLVIECDGHDFHEKTKEQVRKNNERDMAIKSAGYDIIHFSGSQIYREPLKCAKQAVNYISSKIKIINHGDNNG